MTSTTSPARNVLFLLSAVSMIGVLYLVFLYAPTDRNLGISQRIFYFHVSMAWVGFFAFFWVLVGSVGYLWKRSERMDRLAYASAEIGVVFTTLMLITGVLWAKPVWGRLVDVGPQAHHVPHPVAHVRRLPDAAGLLAPGRPGGAFRRHTGDSGLLRHSNHLSVRGVVAHRAP